MSSSPEDASSQSRVRVISPEESAASEVGGGLPLRDALRRVLPFLKDKLGAHPEYVRILAVVISATLLAALGLWAAFSGYDMLSRYLASRNAEPPAQESIAEVREEDASVEYEKAKREAQRALIRAERERRINVARIEADKYQWATWQHTLRDIDDNNKRLKEKQRLAEERAAEERRLARIEEQRKAQEAQRKAAEMAKLPRPPGTRAKKKRLRSFD